MKNQNYIVMLLMAMLVACSNGGDGKEGVPSGAVKAPANIEIDRVDEAVVRLTWEDKSDNETGFAIYARNAVDVDHPQLLGKVAANVTEFTASEGLAIGNRYQFGVAALGATEKDNSRITYSAYYLLNSYSGQPTVSFVEPLKGTQCISARYQVLNPSGMAGARVGLCWNESGKPTIEKDAYLYGPEIPAANESMMQAIPNTLLEYGKTYTVRAFVTAQGTTMYSAEQTVSLAAEPAAITLTWNKVNKSALPASIEVYETTSKLNNRNFHAWYAICDVKNSSDVELRMMVPSTVATIDSQASAAGDCYVLINGGYFYNGRNTGISVVNGVTAGSISPVRGSLVGTSDPEWDEMYYVTRGMFGIDNDNKMMACWGATGTDNKNYYYDQPLASIKGEAKYTAVNVCNYATPLNWHPKYALMAGPVLLKNGKCPFDFALTEKGSGYYLSNFEVIPYDIYGSGVIPDRTAMGCTADGKVILFICDGRISSSQGASLTELAMIMKGLGCVDAVNFDGGGSTGMWVVGDHVNDMTGGNRAVSSTIGLFKKK